MFDVQYAEKFGKKRESVEELNSIFKGIKDKLIPGYATIYEWARQRDILLNLKYGKEIDQRTLEAKIKNKEAYNKSLEMLYDPLFKEDKSLSEDDILEIKSKRKILVDTSNEIAILVMQFDNVVEEMASRVYDEIFNDKASDSLYKEGLVRIGFSDEKIISSLLSLRGLRNKFCHSYGFHNLFIDISIGKIHYHRFSIYKIGKVGKRLYEMSRCIDDIKLGYLKRSVHFKTVQNEKVKYWFNFPKNAKFFQF